MKFIIALFVLVAAVMASTGTFWHITDTHLEMGYKVGADVKEKHAQKAADIFADICPNADVNLINGGQPVYYYLISAE